jgi:hypothetical protein
LAFGQEAAKALRYPGVINRTIIVNRHRNDEPSRLDSCERIRTIYESHFGHTDQYP